MKTSIVLFLLFSLPFCLQTKAQDRLLLRNGDELQVRVLEITPDSLFFIRTQPDSAQNKIETLSKLSIFSITYQNGFKTVIPEPALAPTAQVSEAAYFARGQQDAKQFHRAPGAFWGTFAATLAVPLGGPLLGIPTGAVLGFTNVPEKRIIASAPEFKQQPSYIEGYQKQARKRKLANATGGLAAGTATLATAIIILIANFQP